MTDNNTSNWNTLYGRYRGNLVTDGFTDTVFISELLPKYCPKLYQSLEKILPENDVECRLLANTKDIWCRDYMPIQVGEKRFVFYKYNPDYLQSKYYQRTITDVNHVAHIEHLRQDGEAVDLELVLDGGNVVKCSDKIIMTEKVFFENKDKTRGTIRDMLEKAFQCEIIFLPWDRYETFGHSDGIVHYIGGNRVLMTNYADFDAAMARKYTRILENYVEVIPLTYNVKRKHNRSWAYINFLKTGRLVLVPQLGIPEDEQALRQISEAMPRSNVIGVPSLEAVRRGGALNCISWNVATTKWSNGFLGEEYKLHGRTMSWIKKAAEDGFAEWQCDLGCCYFYGQGTKEDMAEGNKWYVKSAEQGSRQAKFNIGLSYYLGEGVPKDYEKAIDWFRKAAEQGDADAQLHIAWCLEDLHAPHDEFTSAYRKAAEMGNRDAQCALGYWYLNGEEGYPKDIIEADRWFRRAAEHGEHEAQFQMGVSYDIGRSVKKSKKEAAKWYMRAASKNNVRALYELGCCYYYGDGVRMDNRAAYSRFKRAAERGHAWAIFMLGECYFHGYGVEKDEEEAVKWYIKAASKDIIPAVYELGYCYYHGYGTNEDKKEALDLFRKADEKDYARATCIIGDYYYSGTVVGKDEEEAIKYYNKAAELGCEEARKKLKSILKEREEKRAIFDDVPF